MTSPEKPYREEPHVHLQGSASDDSRFYQAAGDQFVTEGDLHLHYRDGARSVRRTDADGLGDECPYPGMASFGTADARWFFGRKSATALLTGRLDERLRVGGPLAVVASSGAGKSSLLMAGLLPALRGGALPGSRYWPVLAFTPTARPMQALAAQLAMVTGTGADDIADQLTADPEGYAQSLRDVVRTPRGEGGPVNMRLMVVVDQLEELFTLCTDDKERDEFLSFLSQISVAGPGDEPLAAVVYGLRADFYEPCVGHPRLRGVLESDQFLLNPMTQVELREAILYPAEEAGLEVEPGLIELLLRDLGATTAGDTERCERGYKPGRLPLLAHALRATWLQRHGSTLTVEGYRATGGIHDAVADTAERVHAGLGRDAQMVARVLFLRLIRIGDGVEDTRRPMGRGDLLGGLDPALAQAAMDAFTHSRLLTQDQDLVEITHEALLHAWPRLRSWVDTDRVSHLIRQELEHTAVIWERDRRDRSVLYRGNRLEAVRSWATQPSFGLSPAASRFVRASLGQERRTTLRRRGFIAVLVTLVLLAGGAAADAFRQRDAAQAQRDAAVASRLIAEAELLRTTDASLAAQLELAAYRTHASPPTYTALVNASGAPLSTALRGHKGVVHALTYDPSGNTLASAGYDGTVRLWDVTDSNGPPTSSTIRAGDIGALYSVAYSRDGRVMATAGEDGTVRLWDANRQSSPRPVGQIPSNGSGAAYTVAFHPDGRTLITVRAKSRAATGPGITVVGMWDISDPASPTRVGTSLEGFSGRSSPTVSANGQGRGRALVGVGGRLWDVTDPARPVRLERPVLQGGLASIKMALSPDGRILAVAGARGGVQLWDLSDRTATSPLGVLGGHSNAVTAIAFSGDGRAFATGSSDRTALLWNITDPANPVRLGDPLTGHAEQVFSLAFSPDGRTLATAGGDQTVRLWSIPQLALMTGATTMVRSVAYSPNGRLLATAASDLQLWDTTDPDHPTRVGKPLLPSEHGSRSSAGEFGEEFYAVAFTTDGRTMATAGTRGVMLWDVRKPAEPKALGKPFSHDAISGSLAFRPDGRVLITANFGGVALWDISEPAEPRLFGTAPAEEAESAVLGPDGKTLATVTADGDSPGGVQLWDIADPTAPRALGKLPKTGQSINGVTFSPNGRTLAGAGEDGTVRLWDITEPSDPAPLGAPLAKHTDSVRTVAFSPDGGTLASGGEDGTVRLWNVSDPRDATPSGSPLRGSAAWVLSVAFAPSGRTLATAGDQMVRLYYRDADQAAQRVCRAISGSLTSSTWQKHIPDLPMISPCPAHY
ncbi:WD40 repeat domain-containing protein [Streptomyces sp. NPDC001732]